MCASELPPKPGQQLAYRLSHSHSRNNSSTDLKSAIPSSAPAPFYWSYPSSFPPGARQARHFRFASHPSSTTTTRHFSFAAQQRAAAVAKEDRMAAASRFRSGFEGIAEATPSSPRRPSSSSSSTSRTCGSVSTTSTSISISTTATTATAATSLDKITASPSPISSMMPNTTTTTTTLRYSQAQQDSSTKDQSVSRVTDLEAALATARTQQHRLAMELEKMRMQHQKDEHSNQHSHCRHHHSRDHASAIRRPSAPAPAVPSIFSSSMSHSPKKSGFSSNLSMSSSPPPSAMSLYGFSGSSLDTPTRRSGSIGSDDSNCNCQCNCCSDSSNDSSTVDVNDNDDDRIVTELMGEAARNCERMEDRVLFQRQMAQLRDRIYTQAEELSERRKERRKWGQEREELVRELREKEMKIKGLLERGTRADSVQG